MRILYVEDNEANQALVGRVGRARQHEVLFRDEGEGALEALAQDPTIDLVLLDIELAGSLSGIEVIKTLRARDDRRPVVAVTAYAMMGDRERILEAGCDEYLPKPLSIVDLLALVDHYEAESKARRAAEVPGASPPPAMQAAAPAPAPQAVAVLPPQAVALAAEAVTAAPPDRMPEPSPPAGEKQL